MLADEALPGARGVAYVADGRVVFAAQGELAALRGTCTSGLSSNCCACFLSIALVISWFIPHLERRGRCQTPGARSQRAAPPAPARAAAPQPGQRAAPSTRRPIAEVRGMQQREVAGDGSTRQLAQRDDMRVHVHQVAYVVHGQRR